MTWTFVRPADESVLNARPLLDLGVGDAQTVLSVTSLREGVVGLDRSAAVLGAARRSGVPLVVCGDAKELPFAAASIAVVLAADLFHHLDDDALGLVVAEVARALGPDGRVVAWWYRSRGRGGPGDPRFPRSYERVARTVAATGLRPVRLDLVVADGTPPTVGLTARR